MGAGAGGSHDKWEFCLPAVRLWSLGCIFMGAMEARWTSRGRSAMGFAERPGGRLPGEAAPYGTSGGRRTGEPARVAQVQE